MDLGAIIFDLSSDEDLGMTGNLGVGDNGGGVDDCKWIHEFFKDFGGKCDDSSDVVKVSDDEVNPKTESFKKSSKDWVKDCNNDDDDDCVILDSDPNKAVEALNDAGGSDSDELVVVGETGQVACRDYPHPRDLCAKFLFTSTPHEQYCDQCHCYVCDSRAPCPQWGSGISSSDHCHATGKEDFWNQQRESLKKSHQTTHPSPNVPSTSMLTMPIQTNQSSATTLPVQVAPMSSIQYNVSLAQVPRTAPVSSIQYHTPQFPRPASVPPNTSKVIAQRHYHTSQAQTPRSASVMPYKTTTTNVPSIIGQKSGYVMPLQLNSAKQLSSTVNDVLARSRRHTIGSLGPPVNVPTAPLHSAVFKRRGRPGVGFASNQKNGYILNRHGSTKCTRNPLQVSAPANSNTMITADKNMKSNICQPSPQPYIQTVPSNYMAFTPQLQPQPHISSQTSLAINQVPTQTLLSTQSYTGNLLVSSTSQHQIPSHQAYVGNMLLRPVSSQPQMSSHPIITNSFGNTAPSQPQISSQPNHALNSQQNQISSFSDVDLNWFTNTTIPSSQQTQAQNFQLSSLDFLDELGPYNEYDFLFDGGSNTGSSDFRYDNRTLDSSELARVPSQPSSTTLLPGTFYAQ